MCCAKRRLFFLMAKVLNYRVPIHKAFVECTDTKLEMRSPPSVAIPYLAMRPTPGSPSEDPLVKIIRKPLQQGSASSVSSSSALAICAAYGLLLLFVLP